MTVRDGYMPNRETFSTGTTLTEAVLEDTVNIAYYAVDTSGIPSGQRMIWTDQYYQVPVEKRDILFKDGLDESPSRL